MAKQCKCFTSWTNNQCWQFVEFVVKTKGKKWLVCALPTVLTSDGGWTSWQFCGSARSNDWQNCTFFNVVSDCQDCWITHVEIREWLRIYEWKYLARFPAEALRDRQVFQAIKVLSHENCHRLYTHVHTSPFESFIK